MSPAPLAKPINASADTPKTVLLTGFEAFDGASVNSSWLAVSALHGRTIDGCEIVAARLPTTFANSIEELARLVVLHQPTLIICTGQAGNRNAISIERIAININDARIPDNLGAQPVDQPVIAGGNAAYFASLPIKSMLLKLQNAGLQAEVSQTAGTFVCNHVFYGLMQLLEASAGAGHAAELQITRGGFIHLPCLPEQGEPSMTLSNLVSALEICVSSALRDSCDIAYGAGHIS